MSTICHYKVWGSFSEGGRGGTAPVFPLAFGSANNSGNIDVVLFVVLLLVMVTYMKVSGKHRLLL